MKKSPLLGRILQIITFLLIFIFIGLLSIYGIKGIYSRYAQDDYCYGYKEHAMGFWDMQIQSYIHANQYSSDRYSLTVVHGLIAELISAFRPGALSYPTSVIFLGLLGLTLCDYMVRITPRVYAKLPAYQSRAQAWDLRQQLILNEKAAGIQNVIAPAFDNVYGITELHYEAANWVNECAAHILWF